MGPGQESGPQLAPGRTRLGPYEIVDLLGHGGMAAVYLARDRRDGKEVAVKVLARVRPTWAQRFRREFEAARRVRHPNVVRVLEAGEQDGLAFFSMERIDGVMASRYVLGLGPQDVMPTAPPVEAPAIRPPLPPLVLPRTLKVATQLAAAVAAIHEVGLVHRDLKPGNVLVTSDGTVKLVDFGVVKSLEEAEGFTQIGHVVGSYSYMSPEQITGAEVDHRADLYGVGVLLYELLTGAPPFRAKRPQEFLWLHCTAQPDPLAHRVEGVPASLDNLVLRLLAKEPADRPESMRAVERELHGIVAEVEGRGAGARVEFVSAMSADSVLPRVEPLVAEEQTEPVLKRAPARRPERGTPAEHTLLGEGARAPSPALPALPRATGDVDAPERPGDGEAGALVAPRLVGRKAEVDELLEHLRLSRRDGVRLVLVEGEEGVGKSRLLQAFRGLSWVKGARVAVGRCHHSSRAMAAPFHDLLTRIAGPGLARSHVERVLGPDKELLCRAFPGLRARQEGAASTVERDGDEWPAVVRAVGESLRRASADAPLVLGIEDAHWADDATIRLVTAIVRRLSPPRPAPVLLVLTYRSEDLSGEQGEIAPLSTLLSLPIAHRMLLRPLASAESAELLRSVIGELPVPQELVDRVVAASRGLPRYTVEVGRALVEKGVDIGDELPSSLVQAYGRRLDRLPKDARDLARCVAVLGERAPIGIVSTASGLADIAFDLALHELERRRVAEVDRSEREAITLSSEALRRAVLDGLSAGQARALHRRAAAAWLKHGATWDGAAAQAARHFYAAGDARAAFPYSLEAAWRAGEALDLASADRWLEQMGEPGDWLAEVSPEAAHRFHLLKFQSLFTRGDLEEAREQLELARRTASDARAALQVVLAEARLATRRSAYVEAVQHCRFALRDARALGAVDLGVLAAIQGARAARRSGDAQSAIAWLAEADLLLAGRPDLETLIIRVAWTRSAALLDVRPDAESEEAIHAAIAMAQRIPMERAEAGLRTNLSVLCWRRGQIGAAVAHVERALQIVEELGERDQSALAQSNLAELRLLQGRVSEAQRLARSGWDTMLRLRDRDGQVSAAQVLLSIARTRMDKGLAEDVLGTLGDSPKPTEAGAHTWQSAWMERARWHRVRQQRTAAWLAVEEAGRLCPHTPVEHRVRELALLRAEVLYDRGEWARAHGLLETVISGALADGHAPIHWFGRAVRMAIEARLGASPEDIHPPRALLDEHVPLALATGYYRAEAIRSLGDAHRAALVAADALRTARDLGYQDWVQMLEAAGWRDG